MLFYTAAVRALPAWLVQALKQEGRGLTVLVLRLGAMGDILRTLPPVRLLRHALPEALIVWGVEEQWRGLLAEHPDLDRVATVPRKQLDGVIRTPARWLELPGTVARFAEQLRALRVNLAVDFHGNLRSGLVARLSGAAVRLGYAGHQQKEGNRWLTTHRLDPGDRRTPRMERNLALVRALGVAADSLPDGGLALPRLGHGAAMALIRDLNVRASDFAIVSPGASASQAYKKPPTELLAAACRQLERHGFPALVVYGPGEESDARRLCEQAPGATFAPPTDLATLAALLARARLFLGGDSGPLHLACAVGCPVLGIYGPTDPQVNQPWGVPFRTVYPARRVYTGVKRLDRRAGFDGLQADKVAAAVDELLAGRGDVLLRGPRRF